MTGHVLPLGAFRRSHVWNHSLRDPHHWHVAVCLDSTPVPMVRGTDGLPHSLHGGAM